MFFAVLKWSTVSHPSKSDIIIGLGIVDRTDLHTAGLWDDVIFSMHGGTSRKYFAFYVPWDHVINNYDTAGGILTKIFNTALNFCSPIIHQFRQTKSIVLTTLDPQPMSMCLRSLRLEFRQPSVASFSCLHYHNSTNQSSSSISLHCWERNPRKS